MNLLDLMVKIGLDDKVSNQIGNVASTVGKATAAMAAGAVAATAAIAAGINSVAEYGDTVDKMSQKMGLSAQAYQEWDSIMRHSGTSIETMKASMKTLANAVEGGNEAFERIGLTQEQIASMSQEELFGATIKGLQNVSSTTERTYLAGQLLGRGATELGALLNTSAEDTEAMRQRVHELGGVMSDDAVKASAKFKDSLQDLGTAITGMKNKALGKLIPSVTSIMDGLQEVLIGNVDKGMALIEQGINEFDRIITENLPKVAETVNRLLPLLLQVLVSIVKTIAMQIPSLIRTLVPVIIDMFPVILEAGFEMFLALLDALVEAIPQIIDALPQLITQVAGAIEKYMPKILEAGMKLFLALVTAVVRSVPQIVQAIITQLIPAIINGILSGLGKMAEAAGVFIGTFIDGILAGKDPAQAAADALAKAAGNGITQSGITDTVYRYGTNVVEGLIRGIQSLEWHAYAVAQNVANNVANNLASALGIASPSRVTRKLGEYVSEGLAVGIQDASRLAINAASDMANAVTKAVEVTPQVISPNIAAFSAETLAEHMSVGGMRGELTMMLDEITQQSAIIEFLEKFLPETIADYTPYQGKYDFNRSVRKAVA